MAFDFLAEFIPSTSTLYVYASFLLLLSLIKGAAGVGPQQYCQILVFLESFFRTIARTLLTIVSKVSNEPKKQKKMDNILVLG